MVVLNLTLLIQVGLFLLFMAVTHVLVLKPMLRAMDERQAKMEGDTAQARTDNAAAEDLEAQYAAAIAAARRAASIATAQAIRSAQEEHLNAVAERRKAADAAVAEVRGKAQEKVAGERAGYDALTPALAQAMAERMGISGGGKA